MKQPTLTNGSLRRSTHLDALITWGRFASVNPPQAAPASRDVAAAADDGCRPTPEALGISPRTSGAGPHEELPLIRCARSRPSPAMLDPALGVAASLQASGRFRGGDF